MQTIEQWCRRQSVAAEGVEGWAWGMFGGLRYQYEIALIQECVPGRIYYGA